jgi:hypothetical protein
LFSNSRAFKDFQVLYVVRTLLYLPRVRTGSGKPGKSWNFNIPKSRPGNTGKSILVMEN